MAAKARGEAFDVTFLSGYVHFTVWASRRTLDTVEKLSEEEFARDLMGPFGSIRGSLVHTYSGDLGWYAGLSGEEPPPPKWMTKEVWENQGKAQVGRDELLRDYRELLGRWEGLAGRLEDPEFAAGFASGTMEGHGHRFPKWQALVNIVSHATYHRGQVATFVRQLGHKPADTDIIRYYFEQAGQPWPY